MYEGSTTRVKRVVALHPLQDFSQGTIGVRTRKQNEVTKGRKEPPIPHTGLPTSVSGPRTLPTTPYRRRSDVLSSTTPGVRFDTSRQRSGTEGRDIGGEDDPVGGLYKRKTSVRSRTTPSWEALQERERRWGDASDTDRLLPARVTNIVVSCTLLHPPIALSCTSPRGERGPHEHRPARHRRP